MDELLHKKLETAHYKDTTVRLTFKEDVKVCQSGWDFNFPEDGEYTIGGFVNYQTDFTKALDSKGEHRRKGQTVMIHQPGKSFCVFEESIADITPVGSGGRKRTRRTKRRGRRTRRTR
jgi:hypothetical protein